MAPKIEVSWSRATRLGISSPEAPALADFKGRLHLGWTADDPSRRLYVASSADGINWVEDKLDATSPLGPSLAPANFPGVQGHGERLYMAYRANDASHRLYLASSPDGAAWSGSRRLDFTSPREPALACFKERLWLAWTASDASQRLYLASTADGVKMSEPRRLSEASEEAPVLLSTPDRLYLTFKEKGGENRLCLMSTEDGEHWSGAERLAAESPQKPALAVLSAGAADAPIAAPGLLMVWCANDISNSLYAAISDGRDWSAAKRYEMESPRAPALAWREKTLYLAWTSNDTSHKVCVATLK